MQTVCEAEEIPSLSSDELSFGSRSKSLLSDSSSLIAERTTDCLSFFENDELKEMASINRKIIATNKMIDLPSGTFFLVTTSSH